VTWHDHRHHHHGHTRQRPPNRFQTIETSEASPVAVISCPFNMINSYKDQWIYIIIIIIVVVVTSDELKTHTS
jgi:hypothetical protein